jgi:hypothetical protein
VASLHTKAPGPEEGCGGLGVWGPTKNAPEAQLEEHETTDLGVCGFEPRQARQFQRIFDITRRMVVHLEVGWEP